MSAVLVIGAGVVGLTSAHELLNAGYNVTIVADRFNEAPTSYMTSEVAGALWEWPPAVCGYHGETDVSVENSKRWCMVSYWKFMKLASEEPDVGIYPRKSIFYQRQKVETNERQNRKMEELKFLPGFSHDSGLVKEYNINACFGVNDAYTYISPVVDTTHMMKWLVKQCKDRGATFYKRHICGSLLDNVGTLLNQYNVDYIVNCTGLGARELADDKDVYPIRGMLLKVANDGTKMPKLETAFVMCTADHRDHHIVFILPRGENDLLIGGLVEVDETQTEGVTFNNPEIQRMFKNCQEFYPALKAYGECDIKEVIVGLRPFRKEAVRVELDSSSRKIIHNYGHGGSGWTFSWGCAGDVLKIIQQEDQLKSWKSMLSSQL